MKSRYSVIALLFVIWGCFSQKAKINNANKDHEQMAYLKASEIYLQVAENGYKSEELFKNLGDSFYFNANYKQAAKWYGALFDLAAIEDPIYLLRYSQSLRVAGNTQKSNEVYSHYAKIAKVNPDFNSNSNVSQKYIIEHLNINTSASDFGGFVKDNVFYFSSNGQKDAEKRIGDWDGLPFLDLYQVRVTNGVPVGSVAKMNGKMNSVYHDVSVCITKDGTTMYFTRTNTSKIRKLDGFKTEYLKIYSAKLVNGEWNDIKELPINGSKFSTAHPALNDNEDRLYFVSDRPGSIGQTDIFYVPISKEGIWGEVVNAGKQINTIGRESFPFVNNGILYFSSEGHLGLGGYDVFYTPEKDLTTVTNIGKPINSAYDDFAFYFDSTIKRGFISSNREGGQGNDDIYGFKEIQFKISGAVIDRENKTPITGATITLSDASNTAIATVKSDGDGNFEYVSNIRPAFVKVDKAEFSSDEKTVSISSEEFKNDFVLTRNIFEVKEGIDIAKALNIKEIYFDRNKSEIRQDAEVELEKVLVVLEKYPNVKIEIKSHADSSGDEKYNMVLSQKRAKSVVAYLVNKGISKERLSGKGYGETQLYKDCEKGSGCTEEENQLNRRSEFILKLDK